MSMFNTCSAWASLQDTTSLLLCINPCILVSFARILLSVRVSLVRSLLVMSSSKEVSVKCSQVPGGGNSMHEYNIFIRMVTDRRPDADLIFFSPLFDAEVSIAWVVDTLYVVGLPTPSPLLRVARYRGIDPLFQ